MRFAFTPVLLATPLALVGTMVLAGCTSDETTEGDLSSCGNIEVSASASCTVEVTGGCTAHCEPISFTAACDGECNASFSASCKGSCEGDCTAECEVDPGSFDCEATCGADCQGECEGQCSGDNCSGRCEATCEAQCEGSCSGTPPSAECSAKCEASCEGQCTAEANFDCSLQCQLDLQGGCTARCDSPDGGLFCDGQFVDTGDNLAECIAALNAILDIDVDASASAVCEDGKCTAEASASCGAGSVAGMSGDAGLPWYAAALSALGIAVVRRRRR